MEKLKDSQQMLNFLKDLSSFTQAFGNIDPSMFTAGASAPPPKEDNKADNNQPKQEQTPPKADEKNPQSPTAGIADEFIQNILESYLNKSGNS